METRSARLAIHAARTGALDYGQYGRYNRYWQIREEVILRDIEQSFLLQVQQAIHQWHTVLAAPSGLEGDEKRAEFHIKEAKTAFNDIGKLLLPWYKAWADEGQTLAKLWAEFKRQEQDPVYAKFLEGERQKLRDLTTRVRDEMRALEQAQGALQDFRDDIARRRRRR